VEQVDSRSKQVLKGTLTIDVSSGTMRGTLAWGEPLNRTARLTVLEVSDAKFKFIADYGGDNGVYEASLGRTGDKFAGQTGGVTSGARAEWSGTRSRARSAAGLAGLAGSWNVTQESDPRFTGVLTLRSDGESLVGTLNWTGWLIGNVVNARLDGRRFRFTLRYPGGSPPGDYEATVNERGTALVGTTSGGNATAQWSAVRSTP
jgi:hypothetical protein